MQNIASTAASRPPCSALVLGLVLCGAGVIGLIQMSLDPFLADIDAGAADPGPALFPRILLILLIAGGLGQIAVATYHGIRAGGFSRSAEFSPARLAVPFALLVSVYVYAKLLPHLGYLTATVVFALCWLAAIGWIDRSLPKTRFAAGYVILIETVVICGALIAIFGYGIGVPLP